MTPGAAMRNDVIADIQRVAYELGVAVEDLTHQQYHAHRGVVFGFARDVRWTDYRQAAANDNGRGFTVEHPPSELPTIDELLSRRRAEFRRKQAHEEAARLVPVTVKLEGPIGILHMGDPHLDDPGTDIDTIERHVRLCQSTEGLFCATVGDLQNNWIGRLARLYAEQSTTGAEAWMLVEWLVREADFLYLVSGNHDLWSGAGDPLKWMARQTGTLRQSSECRMELRFPKGRPCRVNARHDFKGRSQWNPAHGPAKAAMMGFHDHILVAGHTHVSGYNLVKDPASGTISHCLRVASYKIWDRYAKEAGFRDQHISPAVVTVIDPEAERESGFVTVFHDVEHGAEYLTWLRQKRSR